MPPVLQSSRRCDRPLTSLVPVTSSVLPSSAPDPKDALGAPLEPAWLADHNEALLADPLARAVRNAVATTGVEELSLDRGVVTSIDSSVSERIDDAPVTDQKHSGRCWIFAGLNVLRARIAAGTGLAETELSENFVYFHDMVEKCNIFLVRAIRDAGRPLDDREVLAELARPIGDGGYWPEFAALVRKYGVVPVWAMPDTDSATDSAAMDRHLSTVLRRAGLRLRADVAQGRDPEPTWRAALEDAHRILATHLGTPPTHFVWQYRDKDKNFVRAGSLTPRTFVEHCVGGLEDYVVLAHDPRPGIETNRRYAIDRSSAMVGEPDCEHVSVGLDVLKDAAVVAIGAGEPVWFSCDVIKQREKRAGLFHAHLHDYEALYGVRLDMTKAERLASGETGASHAMCLTGVDLVEGRPRRWRVENSWGDETGEKGYWTMDDSWFDEYVFHVVARVERLPEQVRAALRGPVTVLPSWDALR